MEWTQFILFVLGVFGLFLWNRTEGREDARHMDGKLESIRALTIAIHEESKDFHARLLVLEDRYLRLREKE